MMLINSDFSTYLSLFSYDFELLTYNIRIIIILIMFILVICRWQRVLMEKYGSAKRKCWKKGAENKSQKLPRVLPKWPEVHFNEWWNASQSFFSSLFYNFSRPVNHVKSSLAANVTTLAFQLKMVKRCFSSQFNCFSNQSRSTLPL